MFNGYNETPLISSYNDYEQEREKKQENGGKWSYGADQFAQHHSNNRQSEFWSPKPNLIGIPSVVNIPSKCNCSGCYSSPENQSYQGDTTRHRPWLPRTFPIPLNGSNESCKLPGYHQWDNVGLSSQGPCFSEGNPLSAQYLQENGGKHPYYRSYQNSRLSEHNQPGVITSVKNPDFLKKDVLIKQKDELPANTGAHEMVFFGQNGTKQPMFCNPSYNLARNMEKRIENRSCSSSYCDPSEKYSALDSCRHSSSAGSCGLEQHGSRLPVVEPYMKTVPSTPNQSRVPSTGHRSLKESKSQSYINQSYCDARKIICSEGNQAVNGNKNGRPLYPPAVVKEGTACENFQSGQLHNLPPPMTMDLKSSGVHIDYSHFNANRDFSRSCAKMSESETQKYMFENNRHSDYYSRNSASDAMKRNNQVPLLDAKKDCAINQIGQMNMSEQHCGNLPRSNHISNMPKYLEVGNSKSSCGVYYAKDYNGDKISKSDKFDQMPENPMTFQRNEDGLKNDNLNVHARIPRSALVFNDPRDARFADRAQNSYSYPNSTIPYKNYVRSEYSYQGYNTQGRYEYPHVPHGVGGLQRNDLNQYNHRVMPQQQPPNFGSDQFLPHASNSFGYDTHCQQSGNSEKSLTQQFSPGSLVPVASSVSDHNSVDVRLDLPLEVRKPNNIETIRADDVNKNGNSKISPLRLLRKKKFANQKNETVLESIPSGSNPADTVPALDVRKFWSTWAEEEDENIPTQMVVLDCQNIDPEQAKFLHLYEGDPARAMRLENDGVVTLKGSSCDKDSSNLSTHFNADSQEVNIGYDQVSLLNDPKNASPIIGKQNGENRVEIPQEEDAPTVGKSFEENSKVETLDTPSEMGSAKGGEIEPPCEKPVDPVDQKTDVMSPKNDGKPCKRGRSRASQENKDSHRGKKVNPDKKTEKVNRLDKWTEKKFDFLKRAEESKAAEILRHEEEKKRIFERRLSFQQGNVTSEGKKISSHSKTSIVKEKLEMVNKESKSSLANPDFENKVVDEIFKSLSPFDDNSISNSSEDSKGDLPHLPTSEYRRNKFLDYSEKKLFSNNGFSSSLENLRGLDLGSNGEAVLNEDTNSKSNENYVLSKGHHSLPVSESEEIKKEKLIKRECLTSNTWSSSEKYLTEKLGNNIFHSSLDESLIDNIKLKGESGLHSFVMEDILKKMSEINFQNAEVKSESLDREGIMNALKGELVVEKANKSNKRVKKAKKLLEHQEESDERTDKLTVENISVSKPTIKFSIQKSHDLKISFKVLNSSKKYEKCESDEEPGRKEIEGKSGDSVDESKNSTELITLKLKSVQRDGSNCDRSRKLSKKIPFSRNGTVLKKNRRRFRRKKIRGDGLSPLKTPVLKIKKSRYLLQDEEQDPLAEDTDYEKCLNLSRKGCSDEYSTSDDFQVQETIDSAKIKLTFKRHRGNFETEYKIDNNEDNEDNNNNNHTNNNNNVEDLQVDLEPEGKSKVAEIDDECPSVSKPRFKKKSKRNKQEEIFEEGSVKSFKCEGENAKETSEPNVDSDFETIPKDGELKSVPEEGSLNSASFQDLFGEDEDYNFNEEDEEAEEKEPESTSRISPGVLSDLPLIVPSFETHENDAEGEEQSLNFPDMNSNCFLEGEPVVKENSVENGSNGSESLMENDVDDLLAKSKSEAEVNPTGGSHTNDDNSQKEVRLTKVNRNSDEEGERKCENSCLGGTAESLDDETLQEYPTGTVRMRDAVEGVTSAVGESGKEERFEDVDVGINNEDTSLGSIRTYSHENENKETNFESDKNDSNTLISRDDDSFECEDLENDVDGMNYGGELAETSDDNNNNNEDNAKQLICSGQNYEDEKSSEMESSDSSTNQENHSKNKCSYESEPDKGKQVEQTYPTDSSLNYYCPDERTGEGRSEEVVDSVKDSEYAEEFSEKVPDDWKNYSNSLISDVDDLTENLSNSYELEGNRLFDQVDSLLTIDKNFNEGDVEMDSRDLLNGDKFSAGENSTSLGLLDASESQNTSEFGEGSAKEEDSKPGEEVDSEKVDEEDPREKVEDETNVSPDENDQEEKTKSPPEVEYSLENDSRSVDKVDESCVEERNDEDSNEREDDIVDQADGSAMIKTPDFYSSPLSPKSVSQSGDNSKLGGDDNARDLKQIDIGGSDRDVKEISEVPDCSREENQLSETNVPADKSLSLVETILSDIACERDGMDEGSALAGAYGDSVVDFISEFSENQRSCGDALEESENLSNEVPENQSNDNELEEGEIVDDDSAECSEDVFVGMTKETESIEEETVFDLKQSEGFCANNIDSPRKETETAVEDASEQNGEESNGKHESVNIPLDVSVGNDCQIKNSCRYFLEEIKFDKSRIRRRHSFKVESERSTESQKFKFNKRMSPYEKGSNFYNFKAQSCPPSIQFISRTDRQNQIAVLDIPVEDIPLPPGDPPPENCFNLEEYFKKCKNENEPKTSESNLDLELSKPTEVNQSKEGETNPLISFTSPVDESPVDSLTEELNATSKQILSLKEDMSHLAPSSADSKSPFTSSDLKGCRNPSPPVSKEELEIPFTPNPVDSSKNDSSKPEGFDGISEMMELSSKEVKTEDSVTTKSEEIDWSPLNHDEGWQMDDLNDGNVDSSLVLESPVQLIPKDNTTELSLHESIPLTQAIYDDITKSPVEVDMNFENESVKDQAFSLPIFSNAEDDLMTENGNRNPDEINGTKEKDSKEREEMETIDNRPEENEKTNESEVGEDKNRSFSEIKDEVSVNTLNSETDEIQNDYANASPLKLICEEVDMEEMELRDLGPKTADIIDDDSLNVLGFENEDYIRSEFYECEDIPTSEDLPNGDQNEDDKVSDDDKFRNIMQNCLDNAKKFLNEGHLKLFSGSVDDLLELDCQMMGENEAEKSTPDSANHISRDVLLTSCEDTVTDDLGLSQKFQPEDLSMDFVPSFCSDGSNNLCPEILPVDNWPYLEEEVPLSPTKSKQDETDLFQMDENQLENVADEVTEDIEEGKDLDKSEEIIPPVVNNGSFRTKRKSLSGAKGNADKLNRLKARRMSFPGLENSSFKRFRRKSLLSENQTFKMRSSITAKRRKTIDGFTGDALRKPSMKTVLDDVASELETEVDETSETWQGGKTLKCRLSLEKIRNSKPYQDKYQNMINTSPETDSENSTKDTKTVSKDVKSLKSVESSVKGDPDHAIPSKRKNFHKFQTLPWQPKVMLSRISRKELKRIRGKSKSETESVEDRIHSKRHSQVDFSKEMAISEHDSESCEVDESYSRPAFKKQRPNSLSETSELEQDIDSNDSSEKSKLYVKSNSKNRAKYSDGKVEGQRDNGYQKSSAGALDKHSFGSHKLEKSAKNRKKENHRGSEGSRKAQGMESGEEKLNSPVSNPVEVRKHKKSRFRNLHSSKKSEPHSNLNPLAKDISSPAQNILPLDDPKLVEAERVLSEIFRDCDSPQKEIISSPKKSTKGLLSNNKCDDGENVKRKLTVCKDETTLIDKKAKSSVDSPKKSEDHSARSSSKSIHSKHSHSSSVSEKTVKTGRESDKGHSHTSHKHSRESSKRRRSESCHSYKDEKKESSEKGYSKHEERKGERCESRERHKSDSERHSRHERKREKHDGARDRRKESSRRHSRHENSTTLSGSKSQSKEKHTEAKNSKSFVHRNEESRPKGSPEVEGNESCGGEESDLDSPWVCEVCNFDDATERIAHIKTHPFHCQSCHLAFKTESYFISHLTKKHKDIRNQHHCLLCELSFDTEEQYHQHLETREHRHLESVEKNTINTLFTLLTGQPCPVLGLVEMKPEWLPNQAGTVHFYHQATPLSLALQYLKMHHDLSSSSTVASAHLN